MSSDLEAKGVHAWFGKHHALSDVSLTFSAGTVTALIGPSGCGKSTFIRTLNRMHEFIPTAAMAGEVLLNGKDIYSPNNYTPDSGKISYIRDKKVLNPPIGINNIIHNIDSVKLNLSSINNLSP